LVTTGSEGQSGTEDDIALWQDIHSTPAIDYLTIHIWPSNWGWLDRANMPATFDKAVALILKITWQGTPLLPNK
jgi:mannan endo-1,4-beta-mannosidase